MMVQHDWIVARVWCGQWEYFTGLAYGVPQWSAREACARPLARRRAEYLADAVDGFVRRWRGGSR